MFKDIIQHALQSRSPLSRVRGSPRKLGGSNREWPKLIRPPLLRVKLGDVCLGLSKADLQPVDLSLKAGHLLPLDLRLTHGSAALELALLLAVASEKRCCPPLRGYIIFVRRSGTSLPEMRAVFFRASAISFVVVTSRFHFWEYLSFLSVRAFSLNFLKAAVDSDMHI